MDKSLSKLYLFDLDNLLTVVKPLYSDTGRPADNQQGIIRSLVLMLDFNEHSITNWAPKVASDGCFVLHAALNLVKHLLFLSIMI